MELVQGLLPAAGLWDDWTMLSALVFAGVLLTVVGLAGLLAGDGPVERRLAGGAGADAPPRPAVALRKDDGGGKRGSRVEVRDRLTRAGYRSPKAVAAFYATRLVLSLGLCLAVVAIYPLASRSFDLQKLLVLMAWLGLIGFYLPSFVVGARIRKRQRAAREEFPDVLDMLLVCVEAGQSLDAAINRVALEVSGAQPVLAEELRLVAQELRAGKPRADVLRDMARRVDVDDIRAFVTVLTHSDRFGTSIGDALRVYAAEMRAKRMVRAEEAANKLPPKLTLATMGCTMPPMMLILAGPALITLLDALRLLVERN